MNATDREIYIVKRISSRLVSHFGCVNTLCALMIAGAALHGQSLDPHNPSKEYIRLGARVIAIENNASVGSIGVNVQPNSIPLNAGGTQQFTATVVGASNMSVSWTINPSNAGSISSAGLYTAPASISVAQIVQVIATSLADPTKSGSASILLSPALVGGFPQGWTSVSINGAGGSSAYSNGVFSLVTNGGSLGGTADGLLFVYTPMVGDGTIVARMTGYTAGAGSGVDGGITLRAGLAGNAAMAFVGIENINGSTATMKWRTDTGQTVPAAVTNGVVGVPYWFKLVRTGTTITASMSADGVTWTTVGAETLNIGSVTTLYAGLALAGECCWNSSASFDNVTVSTVPDFYLTTFPLTWTTTTAGDTNSYAVGVGALNGFTGPVNLSVAGLPSAATVTLNPGSVSGGAGRSSLTISTVAGTAAGSYPFTVAATSGSITHTVGATMNVNQNPSGTLPLGWTSSGINGGGGSSYANGVFTVTSQDGNIGGTADGLQFAYTPMVGDGSIVSMMPGYTPGANGADGGVMLRTGPTPTASMMFAGIENGAVMVKWRTGNGQAAQTWTGPAVGVPYWFKLSRVTDSMGNITVTPYASPNGVDWTAMGAAGATSQILTDAGTTLYAGLAAVGRCCWPTTATFSNVTVLGTNGSSTADFSIATPTTPQVVNAVGSTNVTVTVNTTGGFNSPVGLSVDPASVPNGITTSFSPPAVSGPGASAMIVTAGSNVTGSFTLSVVGTSGATSHTAPAAIMVNTPATAPPSSLSVSPASGSGGSGTFTFAATDASGAGGNIAWMEMLFNSSLSGVQGCYLHYDQGLQKLYLRDDTNPGWVGSAPVPMGSAQLNNSQCTVTAATATVTGGQLALAVTITFKAQFAGSWKVYEVASDAGGVNSGWDQVGAWTVPVPAGALPSGWTSASINGAGGSSTYSNGVFTLGTNGGILGGTADGLLFGYTPMVGDGTIVARMTAYTAGAGGVDGGVMLRTGPTPTAAMVFVGIENTNGGTATMKWRTDTGQTVPAAITNGVVGVPYWFKLVRAGTTVTASMSADGATWTTVGAETLNIASVTTLYAGLALAGDCCWNSSASFDNVRITQP
jgi:hypothetical protein